MTEKEAKDLIRGLEGIENLALEVKRTTRGAVIAVKAREIIAKIEEGRADSEMSDEIKHDGKRFLRPDAAESPGMRLTDCCGAGSTHHDADLSCKICWQSVGIGEGDGAEFLPIEFY